MKIETYGIGRGQKEAYSEEDGRIEENNTKAGTESGQMRKNGNDTTKERI